jgi:hypothetical protein
MSAFNLAFMQANPFLFCWITDNCSSCWLSILSYFDLLTLLVAFCWAYASFVLTFRAGLSSCDLRSGIPDSLSFLVVFCWHSLLVAHTASLPVSYPLSTVAFHTGISFMLAFNIAFFLASRSPCQAFNMAFLLDYLLCRLY